MAAALQLADEGLRPLIVDVGHARPDKLPYVADNLYSHRREHDTYDLLIGERFQGLGNLLGRRPVPAKLTAPNLEYVTRDAERLSPIAESGFCAIQSFATGGLANAWGAGLYRFCDGDLVDFPIQVGQLSPYFDRLTREIGISGTNDDLAPFFGTPASLYPPLRLSHNAGKLYARYGVRRPYFRERGIFVGRAHVAVLTEEKEGREVCGYTNTEMWQESAAIYSPAMTLKRLTDSDKALYRTGILVQSWSESEEGVQVEGLDLGSQQPVRFAGKALILAAGAINSAKIVLRTHRDFDTKLPLLENPALLIPLVLLQSIGRRLDKDAFGLVQLNLIWECGSFGTRLQGSIMELTSPARAEFFRRLPYCARENLALLRYLLPGMLLMQLFFPDDPAHAARLSLHPLGHLRIEGPSRRIEPKGTVPLLRALRRIGVWTHPSLIVSVPAGHSIHYAGTLPMSAAPRSYGCEPCGRLWGTKRVYVADSASFPVLPAKNMSFGMMANAMRIASEAARHVRGNS